MDLLVWGLIAILLISNFRLVGYIVIYALTPLFILLGLIQFLLMALHILPPKPEPVTNRYSFQWPMVRDGKKGIYIWQDNDRFAFLESDGSTLVPETLTHWRVVTVHDAGNAPLWDDGPELTEEEKQEIILTAHAYLDEARNELMQMSREYSLKMSHKPFGRELMETVVQDLLSGKEICEGHRDYCGHGLFYREGKFILAKVDSGEPFHTLGEWEDQKSFIEFFAQQSDYTCSGANPSLPIFRAEETWDLGNQRLTRKRLESLRQLSCE